MMQLSPISNGERKTKILLTWIQNWLVKGCSNRMKLHSDFMMSVTKVRISMGKSKVLSMIMDSRLSLDQETVFI